MELIQYHHEIIFSFDHMISLSLTCSNFRFRPTTWSISFNSTQTNKISFILFVLLCTISWWDYNYRKDTSLQVLYLIQVISTGWPDNKKVALLEVRAYFHCCDELSVQNGLIFESDSVVVPTSFRDDMIKKLHSSHLRIEASLYRAARHSIGH